MLTRNQAKMIAEELFKLIRGDIRQVSAEIQLSETEEYLSMKEAANFLGVCYNTVWKRKEEWGCYLKVGNRILFPKSKLNQVIAQGRL